MVKRKSKKKGMKVGETVVRTLKVRGEMRKCYVTKQRGGTYRKRLVNPRTNKYAGKKPRSGAGHFNYGSAYTSDRNHPYMNKREKWESRGRQ